jgi:hypothetical protein
MMLHDNKVIKPSDFPDSVTSGMTIEMSIVLRQRASIYSVKKCPRCGHINNISFASDDGWIEWEVPPISVTINN